MLHQHHYDFKNNCDILMYVTFEILYLYKFYRSLYMINC